MQYTEKVYKLLQMQIVCYTVFVFVYSAFQRSTSGYKIKNISTQDGLKNKTPSFSPPLLNSWKVIFLQCPQSKSKTSHHIPSF